MSQLTELPWFVVERRIYVASSWRNDHQPGVVAELRAAGHAVYDFKNPMPGNSGFAWSDIDPDWLNWSPGEFADRVQHHQIALRGFTYDKAALDWCDTCVLVLPCGRSAHLEAGYAAGQGKRVIWWLHPDRFEPELMYLLGHDFVLGEDKVVVPFRTRPGFIDSGDCRVCGTSTSLNADRRCLPCYDGGKGVAS